MTASLQLPARTFGLLEVVIVCALLAALAGLLIVTIGPGEAAARESLRERRLHELREALLRFRRDTGYLPGEGPFALGADGVATPAAPLAPFADLPEWQAWLESPANLIMLIRPPTTNGATTDPYDWILQGQAAALAAWSDDRQRGWRGPYLKRDSYAWVRISRGLQRDGSGSPVATVPTDLLPHLPAVFDSELPAHEPAGGIAGSFEWRSVPPGVPGSRVLDPAPGRPLYVFNASTVDSTGRYSFARVVSAGSDGEYVPQVIAPLTPSDPLFLDWSIPPAAPDRSQDAIPGPYSDDLGQFLVR